MGDRTNDLTLADVMQPRPPLQRALTAGMEGLDVARLQSDLRRLGLALGNIDGVFGERTTAAVKEFAARRNLPDPAGTVDATLWSAICREAALAHADALEGLARALEQSADGPRDRAAALQKSAIDKRAQTQPAGADEEQAAGELARAAQQWRAAAQTWLQAAQEAAKHDDPDGRVWKAYAHHLRAADLARSHAARVVNSLALAGRDLDALGGTDHRERLAAATLAARTLAAE